MFKTKSENTVAKEFDRQVSNIDQKSGQEKELEIEGFFDLLAQSRELGLFALERPNALRIQNSDGWRVSDHIASYAQKEVVLAFLDRVKSDEMHKKLIGEVHKIYPDNELASFTLAIINLRTQGIDDKPYFGLAEELGLLKTILKE